VAAVKQAAAWPVRPQVHQVPVASWAGPPVRAEQAGSVALEVPVVQTAHQAQGVLVALVALVALENPPDPMDLMDLMDLMDPKDQVARKATVALGESVVPVALVALAGPPRADQPPRSDPMVPQAVAGRVA
jgi:hypothetical protein